MKYTLTIIILILNGCVAKPVCMNSNKIFQSVFDVERGCSMRIKEVVIGSDIGLPKSLSFNETTTVWEYRWVQSSFKDGILELGHFVLVPMNKGGGH